MAARWRDSNSAWRCGGRRGGDGAGGRRRVEYSLNFGGESRTRRRFAERDIVKMVGGWSAVVSGNGARVGFEKEGFSYPGEGSSEAGGLVMSNI